jgi:hypothetical protein
MPEAMGITPNQPCLGFTLCKPLLRNAGGLSHYPTPKARWGHSEGHYSSPYWLCWCSVRCPIELFCSATWQDKRILHIYISISIYVSCCSHTSLNPWPVLYLIKSKGTCGWCLRETVWDSTHWHSQSL